MGWLAKSECSSCSPAVFGTLRRRWWADNGSDCQGPAQETHYASGVSKVAQHFSYLAHLIVVSRAKLH